jgi:hypothetical protein
MALEIDRALRDVARHLALRHDIEGLAPLLLLPEYPRPPRDDPGVRELISLGRSVKSAVLVTARSGGRATKARSAAVLEGVGEHEAADGMRRLLDHEDDLPGFRSTDDRRAWEALAQKRRVSFWTAWLSALALVGGFVAVASVTYPTSAAPGVVRLLAGFLALFGGSAGATTPAAAAKWWQRPIPNSFAVAAGVGLCVLGGLSVATPAWKDFRPGFGVIAGGALPLAAGVVRFTRARRPMEAA